MSACIDSINLQVSDGGGGTQVWPTAPNTNWSGRCRLPSSMEARSLVDSADPGTGERPRGDLVQAEAQQDRRHVATSSGRRGEETPPPGPTAASRSARTRAVNRASCCRRSRARDGSQRRMGLCDSRWKATEDEKFAIKGPQRVCFAIIRL